MSDTFGGSLPGGFEGTLGEFEKHFKYLDQVETLRSLAVEIFDVVGGTEGALIVDSALYGDVTTVQFDWWYQIKNDESELDGQFLFFAAQFPNENLLTFAADMANRDDGGVDYICNAAMLYNDNSARLTQRKLRNLSQTEAFGDSRAPRLLIDPLNDAFHIQGFRQLNNLIDARTSNTSVVESLSNKKINRMRETIVYMTALFDQLKKRTSDFPTEEDF